MLLIGEVSEESLLQARDPGRASPSRSHARKRRRGERAHPAGPRDHEQPSTRGLDQLVLGCLHPDVARSTRLRPSMSFDQPMAHSGSMGEKSHFSSITHALSHALYAQGKYEEAEQLTLECEEVSRPNDVHSQISWRSIRAKTLARKGEHPGGREACTGGRCFRREERLLARTRRRADRPCRSTGTAEQARAGDRGDSEGSRSARAERQRIGRRPDVCPARRTVGVIRSNTVSKGERPEEVASHPRKRRTG